MPAVRLAARTTHFQPTTVNRILAEVRDWEQSTGRKAASLMRGQPDFATPSHIGEALREAIAKGRTGYPDNRGETTLRQAVASRLSRDYSVTYDPAREILATTGATEGVAALLLSVLEDGDEVLLPDPIYDAYHAPIRLAGGVPRPVPANRREGRFTVLPGDLKDALTPRTRLLLLNAPWNPLGTVFTADEWNSYADFVLENGLLLLSDEIYEAITYDEAVHRNPVSLRPDLRPVTVLINSMSKTYAMTGWRCGYCAGPPEVIDAMFRVLQQWSRGPATFVQDAAAAALTGPQDCVEEMRQEYARRRTLVSDRLGGLTGVQVLPAEGGFFSMVDISELGQSSTAVRKRLLQDHGVVVVDGAAYGPGGEGMLRVSFAGGGSLLDTGLERLREGLSAIGAAR